MTGATCLAKKDWNNIYDMLTGGINDKRDI